METFDKVSIRRATGYSAEGKLQATGDGFEWNDADGNVTRISREEFKAMTWTPLHFGFQLSITKLDGTAVNFTGLQFTNLETVPKPLPAGLRHDALEKLSALNLGEIQKEEFLTKGHNWGKLKVDGKTVVFSGEGDRPIFKIPLPDVSAVQYGKDDVTFEFGATTDVPVGEDVLVGMSFHIPTENEDFPNLNIPKDFEEAPELYETQIQQKKEFPAKRFAKMVIPHVDAAGKSEQPIGTFDEVTALVPRGRFEVQLHHSYLKMLGQAQDFKIKYNSILHLFILPKPNPQVTVVVVTLDPPIRKGQTFYNHVLFQFDNAEKMSMELNLEQEELDEKNREHGGALNKEMESEAFDVFAASLRGLSGARMTRPKTFANFANDGCCVRCSYKNDEGFLFILERVFFYIHKPPLCITHDEIESIEFQRQGTNVVSASVKTFDLCIRTHQGAEHQFRGIQRNEWQPLFNFISSKNLTVENVESARQGPAQHVSSIALEDTDLDMPRPSNDTDDEFDPDFELKPNEQGDDDEPDTESDHSSDAEMIDEAQLSDPEPVEDVPEEEDHFITASDAAASKLLETGRRLPAKTARKNAKAKDGNEGEKKKRRKKDKNAPKKNLSAFMFFSKENNEIVRKDNPGLPFSEIGRMTGQKWKDLGPQEKEKYQELAKKDQIRYQEEKEKYTASLQSKTEDGEAAP